MKEHETSNQEAHQRQRSLNRLTGITATWQLSSYISRSDILSCTPCTTSANVAAWECAEWPLGSVRNTRSVDFAEWPCGGSADIPAGIANWDCALEEAQRTGEMRLAGQMAQGNWECPLDTTAAWLQYMQH